MIEEASTPLLLALLVAAGLPLRRRLSAPSDGPAFGWTLAGVYGLLALYGGMLVAETLGLPWRRRWILVILSLAAIAGWAISRRSRQQEGRSRRVPFGWGDAVAMLAIVAVAVAAWRLWVVNPDFVYHWGIKGARFQLARGIDWAFLEAPWNALAHPAYPQLLPALFAATAGFAGRFHEPSMMLWTPLVLLATVVAARQTLAAGVGPLLAETTAPGRTGLRNGPFLTQATVAAVALSSATFTIGHRTAGGPDGLVALAILLAAPSLVDPAAPRRTAQVALAAALAVGSKVEGAPLAVLLVGAFVLAKPARRLRAGVAAALPSIVVAALWWIPAARHGLEESAAGGLPRLDRLGVVLSSALEAAFVDAWHGAAVLFFALPVLVVVRRSRRLASVVGLQLLFYLAVYLAAPPTTDGGGVRFWVLSSFPRLLSHLLPALLVGVGMAFGADAKVSGPAGDSPS